MSPNPDTWPAITVWRPWDQLILRAGKATENRSWPTGYRGPLLIHAGHAVDVTAIDTADALALAPGAAEIARNPAARPGGHVVGLVDLVGCHSCDGACSEWATAGDWHWKLANPRPLPRPIPYPGRQRLWRPPAAVTRAAAVQLGLLDEQPSEELAEAVVS